MCGVAGLHLRDPELYPKLGQMLGAMLAQAAGRGNDSAGVGLYADPAAVPDGQATVCLLAQAQPGTAERVAAADPDLSDVTAASFGQSLVLTAQGSEASLEAGARAALPEAVVVSRGRSLTVLKGAGEPEALAADWRLADRGGWQGVAHTRMATESAVTPGGSHPFSVGPDQCLVHNGSFSNHASIRKALAKQGVHFDSLNDTEVGARFVAGRLAAGASMRQALTDLTKRFDGFYTLLVSSATSFAVVRDAIACKPAIVAETPRLVAVASEYRYLAGLPGIETARIFEPEPEVVYVWERSPLANQLASTSANSL
jgi:glutamate synthase domain-containing protein 1